MDAPPVKYTLTEDGTNIAYAVMGDGPVTIVLNPGGFTHLGLDFDNPDISRLYQALAELARVLVFDKRGTGLSDRGTGVAPLEVRMDDMRAVMDAEGIDNAALLGHSEGGAMALLFAATYPERVSSLVIHCAALGEEARPELPGSGVTRRFNEEMLAMSRERWNSPEQAALVLSRLGNLDDPPQQLVEAIRAYLRMVISRNDAIRLSEIVIGIDLSGVVGTIAVPTLVMARNQDRLVPAERMRHLAGEIPGARFWAQDGPHLLTWEPGIDEAVGQIKEFVLGTPFEVRHNRVLSTVLFSDIVGSTERATALGDQRWSELLDQLDGLVAGQVKRYRGRVVKSTGDGALATFDAPGRAVHCAQAMLETAHSLGLDLRAGLHTGEIELRGNDITGVAVNIAARVEKAANDGEIFVTRTVTDLVAGSGLRFDERGEYELKGLANTWQLFAVTN